MDKNLNHLPLPKPGDMGEMMPRRGDMGGTLPDNAPLGGSYVPFQKTNEKQYKYNEALKNGTLYEALNLPYLDMVNTQSLPSTLETELLALGFVTSDLGLYLDTHPGDKNAVELHNMYVKTVKELTARYEKEYGPLTQFTEIDGDRYHWIDSPWPWDNSSKKEAK